MRVGKGSRGFQAAVEVDCAEDRFESIAQDRGPFTATGQVFLAAEIQRISDSDFARLPCQYGFADQKRFYLGEFAFPLVGVTVEQVFGDDEIEDGVSEELETLVGRDALFLVCIDVRAMSQGKIEQVDVGEAVPQVVLQSDQAFRLFLAYEDPGNASEDADDLLLGFRSAQAPVGQGRPSGGRLLRQLSLNFLTISTAL